MKVLLFLSFLFVSINADYLKTKNVNRCVYDLRPYQNHKGWCYTKSSNDQDYCSTTMKLKDFISGYDYNASASPTCQKRHNLSVTGLSQSEWDYMLAVLAHVLGFSLLFLTAFVAIKI